MMNLKTFSVALLAASALGVELNKQDTFEALQFAQLKPACGNGQPAIQSPGPKGEQFYGTSCQEQLDRVHVDPIAHWVPQDLQSKKIRFYNNTSKPIWINYEAMTIDYLWPQTLRIEPDHQADYDVPADYIDAVRFWPKYDCDGDGQNCTFGESGGIDLPCPPAGCAPSIDSTFQASFRGGNGLDWYGSTQADGFTLPYEMKFNCEDPKIGESSLNCLGLHESACPANVLALNPDKGNKYAGCISPCTYHEDTYWGHNPTTRDQIHQYCCYGAYAGEANCLKGRASNNGYTQFVKAAGCDASSWYYGNYKNQSDDGSIMSCPSGKASFKIAFHDP